MDAIAAKNVHVTVENGSGEHGLASKVAQALQARGFVVNAVRDADSFDYLVTEIQARPLVADKVRTGLGFLQATIKIEPALLTTAKATLR